VEELEEAVGGREMDGQGLPIVLLARQFSQEEMGASDFVPCVEGGKRMQRLVEMLRR
jgi:hypothetical protein